MGKEGSAWVHQAGSWETNGNRMPCLGNFCTVGSQPVDPREGGRHGEVERPGKTGRDSVIQKVLSCLFRDRGLFPKSSGEPKHLVGFLWKISNPQLSGGELEVLERPGTMKVLYLGLSQETLGSRSQPGG